MEVKEELFILMEIAIATFISIHAETEIVGFTQSIIDYTGCTEKQPGRSGIIPLISVWKENPV